MEREAPARLQRGAGERPSPAAARERLSADDRRVERVLLESRLAEGLATEVLHRLEGEGTGE
ncbi:MAG: hypothetical protein R2719_03580 [Micropruina sp.]